MPLPVAAARTPVAIGDLAIILTDYIETVDEPAHKAGAYEIQVIYDDGTITVLSGDLLPHITPEQTAGLIAFIDAMRVQAVTQVLGG